MTAAAQLTLAEAYPDRFLLGLGVSHARLVEGLCGHQYERPLTAMRRYLDAMDKAAEAYRAVKPGERPARVLAALGPSLAAEGADGAHPVIRRLVQQTSACGSGTHLRILPGQPINGSRARHNDQTISAGQRLLHRVWVTMSYDATMRALDALTDNVGFERLTTILLARTGINVRPLGGPGDRARDAVAGLYRAKGGEPLAVTISLNQRWQAKIRADLGRVHDLVSGPRR